MICIYVELDLNLPSSNSAREQCHCSGSVPRLSTKQKHVKKTIQGKCVILASLFSYLYSISSYRTSSYCLNTLTKMLLSLITHIATGSGTYSHVRHNEMYNCFSD